MKRTVMLEKSLLRMGKRGGKADKRGKRRNSLSGASANTEDGARLDIAANGFWGGRSERAYFDVRVFNPYAPSNRHDSLALTYRKHERAKKRVY